MVDKGATQEATITGEEAETLAHGTAVTALAGQRPGLGCRHRSLPADGIGALDRGEAPAVRGQIAASMGSRRSRARRPSAGNQAAWGHARGGAHRAKARKSGVRKGGHRTRGPAPGVAV